MADIERFGGELFLNANQYINTVGQVDRANKSLETSLQGVGKAAEDIGVKFSKGIASGAAEKHGLLIDKSTGRIRKGLELLNEKMDQTVRKYDQLAQSGRASHRQLGEELTRLDSLENTYKRTLEGVLQKTIAVSKADEGDLKAKLALSKAVVTAQNAYKAYQKQITQVNKTGSQINAQNNAIIASYQLLGNKLASATGGVNRIKAAWANLVSRLAPVRSALASVRGALSSTGSGAAGTGVAIGALSKVAGTAGIVLGVVAKAVKLVGNAFKLAISPIKKAIDAIKGFFKAASQVAVGILIRDTIRGLVREFRELVTAGFAAVKFFQALEIRLDLMELRSLRAEGAVESLSDMMAMASDRAQRLTHWIKILSLTSPFTVETLATVTSLNLAMGFTEDMSKRLTVAIAEYTAGMGLSNQVMERIVFNFGQMKSAGKVTGTEMRDLARGAFLPLVDVLNEAARIMGVATGDIMEFRKAAAEGAVDVDTFFQAFINVVDRDFAGASERFSRTLDGVRNRLLNFMKTVIGLEVLGPVAARFAEIASNALDNIMKPEVIERARVLGLSIVRSFDLIRNKAQILMMNLRRLWDAFGFGIPTFESLAFAVAKFTFYMRALIDFVNNIVHKIINIFDDTGETLATMMGRWGYNIVKFFAQGMASALNLVIKVLTWIGNAIARLLSPGSPPKLLPKLPEWGMAAMTEYLKGFTLADFDVLEGIQDPIKDALDILEQTGKIGENQAGKIFARISKTIAEALSTGQIDEDLFADIENITGPFGVEIAELARAQIELAAATEEVRAAEQRLENARLAHSASRIKTNKLIREYNADLRAGADPAFLKAKLAEINASEDAARAAYEEQKAAESDLEQKEKNLEVVAELLELQSKLVDQLLELTKAQIVQPEQPETGGAGGAGGIDPTDEEDKFDLPALPDITLPDEDAIKAQIDSIFEAARLEVERQMAELAAAWEGTGLGQAFAGLSTAWGKAWTSITTFYEDSVQPKIDRFMDRWNEHIPGLQESFGKMSAQISDVWQTVKDVIADVGESLEDSGFGGFSISIENVVDFVVLLIKALGWLVTVLITAAGAIVTGIVTAFMRAGQVIGIFWAVITEFVDNIKQAWQDVSDGTTSVWSAIGTTILNVLGIISATILGALTAIIAFVVGFVEGVIKFFVELYDKLVGNSIIPDMMEDIKEAIMTPLNWIKEKWDEIWGSLVDFWEDTLKPAIEELWKKFETLKDNIVTYLTELITGVFEDFRVFFQETLPTAWETFKTKVSEVWTWFEDHIITPIKEFIDGPLTDLKEMIATTLTNAWNTFKTNVLEPIALKFDTVATAVSNLVTFIGNLSTAVRNFDIGALAALLGFSPSPLAIGIDYASAAMKDMAQIAIPMLSQGIGSLQSAQLLSSPLVNAPSVMGGGGTSNSVDVQMGGVNITSGMDEAIFEARVRRVMVRSLHG